MTRRLYLALTIPLAMLVAGFALVQGYVALVAIRSGAFAYGAVYAFLAVAGIALALTLLRLRQRIRTLGAK